MTPSIRTFLLINLLLSVTFITSLAIIGNLFLEHKDLQAHLDTKITVSALTIQALLPKEANTQELAQIQKRINTIPALQNQFMKDSRELDLNTLYEKVQFQVWNSKGRLLLHSSNMPTYSFNTNKNGLSDVWINGEPWRVFTTIDAETGLKVVVAEQYDFRNVLEGRITQDSIFIMLLTYPFLGLLIWIIVGRGLASLRNIAQEVSNRAPSYLEPVEVERIPLEIKPLITSLNELFIRLREAFEREKRFAADAAHELKTPLAALRAQTQVALNASTEQEQREALQKVLAGVDRSAHVVQQLLTLSRMVPEAGLEQGAKEDVNLVRVAKEVISDLAQDAYVKNTDLELIAPDKPPIIKGNSTAINILLRNLVDNAIKYTPDYSTVKVVIEENRRNIILSVIDNGPGIPQHLRRRVFERFFRIIGNKSPGSGLGLGIVQQIVALHKADIKLGEAEKGIGLKVSIIFSKKNLE